MQDLFSTFNMFAYQFSVLICQSCRHLYFPTKMNIKARLQTAHVGYDKRRIVALCTWDTCTQIFFFNSQEEEIIKFRNKLWGNECCALLFLTVHWKSLKDCILRSFPSYNTALKDSLFSCRMWKYAHSSSSNILP